MNSGVYLWESLPGFCFHGGASTMLKIKRIYIVAVFLLFLGGFFIGSQIFGQSCDTITTAGAINPDPTGNGCVPTSVNSTVLAKSYFVSNAAAFAAAYNSYYPDRLCIGGRFSEFTYGICHSISWFANYININGLSHQEICSCVNNRTPSYGNDDDEFNLYTNQIYDCLNCVPIDQRCWELGTLSELKNNTNFVNGKYVRVILKYDRQTAQCHDTEFVALVSNGCSGIEIDGDTMYRDNAKQSSRMVDGVNMPQCWYDGRLYDGPCEAMGLDTNCGGQLPFPVNDNHNDSLVNPCASNSEIDSFSRGDYSRDTPDSNFATTSTSPLQIAQYFQGVNRVVATLKDEHEKDRDLMGLQFEEQKKHTGIFGNILNAIGGVNTNLRDMLTRLNNLGGSSSDSVNGYTVDGNGTLFDTAGSGGESTSEIPIGDTGTIFSAMRARASDSLYDTSFSVADSDSVASFYNGFKVNIFTGNCDCNEQWFDQADFPFLGTLTIDICRYNIETYTRPLFLFLAAFTLFILYRNWFFDLIRNNV